MNTDCDYSECVGHPGLRDPPQDLRRVSTRTLLALDRIQCCETAPIVSHGRSGHGAEYMQLWTRQPGGRWESVYLGRIGLSEERLLRDRVALRSAMSMATYHRAVRLLRERRRCLRQQALELAACCGFRFWGWRLHQAARAPDIGPDSGHEWPSGESAHTQSSLDHLASRARLLRNLEALREVTAGLKTLYLARLGGYAGCDARSAPRWYRRTLSALRATCSAQANTEASIRRLGKAG